MSIEKDVRDLIEARYGSVRSFAMKIDMPISSLHTILNRGFINSKTSNILRIAEALKISADALGEGKIIPLSEYQTDRSERDIEDSINQIIDFLSSDNIVLIGGKQADQEAIRYLIASMKIGLELAKEHIQKSQEEE